MPPEPAYPYWTGRLAQRESACLTSRRSVVRSHQRPPDRGSFPDNQSVEIFLQTERLILRRFTDADVDLLVELDSDPEVMRFLTGGIPTPRDEIEREVLPSFLDHYRRFPGFGFWAAVEKSTGEFLGWFHLRPPKGGGPDEAELGYRLRRSAWGKGYATEGSVALIRKAFAELAVRRVVSFTMAVNRASRRVMEKAGLVHVRTFYESWPDPIPGTEHGEVEYELRREDWDPSR
jgi:RimJ/RimL family protein N-acetyltransferase